MTENTDNLRKFLDSDDPAMILMGLSMAMTSEVPDDLLPLILSYYMWHDDKTIRAAAKSTFISLAPDKLKKKVKDNLISLISKIGEKINYLRSFYWGFSCRNWFSVL